MRQYVSQNNVHISVVFKLKIKHNYYAYGCNSRIKDKHFLQCCNAYTQRDTCTYMYT